MNISEDKYASIKLLQKALTALGYSYEKFSVNEQDYTRFISPKDNIWLTRDAFISYPMNNGLISHISNKKNLATIFANMYMFPAPETLTYNLSQNSLTKPKQFLKQYEKIVVKPLDSSLSRGLSLNITTEDQLVEAIENVRTHSKTAIIQKQVLGHEIRFTVLNGKVFAALLRKPPCVVGNGTKTVEELVVNENAQRSQLNDTYVKYPQLDESMIGDYITDTRILPKNEVLELNKSSMISGGASIYDIKKDIHMSYIDSVESLVKKIGAKFIVVDVMIQDRNIPADTTNYNFIEFNTAPVLKLFYSCRDTKHFDILQFLVPYIDNAINVTV